MRNFFVALAAAGLAAGCSPLLGLSHGSIATQSTHRHSSAKIQHVVIIIQENRTTDNIFNGFSGADTVRVGMNHLGAQVPLTQVPLYRQAGIWHSSKTWMMEYDKGKMDGFDKVANQIHSPTYAYEYSQQSDVQPYWDIATQYTLADRMFQSNGGPSFPAHLVLISGQVGYQDNPAPKPPWGCDGVPQECFDFTTLGDLMDQSGVTWRYYTPGSNNVAKLSRWVAYDAIRHIRYGNDWTNGDIADSNQIFTDISGGTLPQVTWIVPTGYNSDHAGTGGVDTGPQWVASIVNALGSSQYWPNSAVFITWDDWGGWYDHVVPPAVTGSPLGFRVPLIVASPYAIKNQVTHVNHEFGSILKFTEEQFGLPSLGQDDARADDLADCFNFAQAPIRFTRINPRGSYARFDTTPPDDDATSD